MSAISAASSSTPTTGQYESSIAASSAVAVAEEVLSGSIRDEGSPASEETEESNPSAESDAERDPYQKIIATLREQIKSTNEELVCPFSYTRRYCIADWIMHSLRKRMARSLTRM